MAQVTGAGRAGAMQRAVAAMLQAGGRALMGIAALVMLAGGLTMATPQRAEAVVYCKTVGVPRGCVVRPVAPVAPAARAIVYCTRPGYPVGCRPHPVARSVIYCTRPGYPVGCVAAPAARAIIYCTRPGYPVGCVPR